jgi:hypothetical protein
MSPTLPANALLNDPGFLLWAPLGSSLPTNTVVGSVFTDAWPVAWIPLGITDTGSEFDTNLTVAPIPAAESLDPIAYRTTDRTSQITFMLKNFTATNLQRALNGATTTVTGTTTTTMTQIDPPVLGTETRFMLGWESNDGTVRLVGFQCVNSGSIKTTFAKAPSTATIPFTAMLEKPSTSQPYRWFTAGTARA